MVDTSASSDGLVIDINNDGLATGHQPTWEMGMSKWGKTQKQRKQANSLVCKTTKNNQLTQTQIDTNIAQGKISTNNNNGIKTLNSKLKRNKKELFLPDCKSHRNYLGSEY